MCVPIVRSTICVASVAWCRRSTMRMLCPEEGDYVMTKDMTPAMEEVMGYMLRGASLTWHDAV